MNIDEFNFFETNEFEFKEPDFEFRSSFPLFNFEALKDVQNEEFPLNLISSQKVSEIIEDIVHKKVKTETSSQIVPKKRGRKTVAKNGKQWDDPCITIQEIIENDLSGVPMQSEIKMREEKLRKMREKKALKRAERQKGTTVEVIPSEDPIAEIKNTFGVNFGETIEENQGFLAPKIVFKDGKIVVDNSSLSLNEERRKNLTVIEKKPYKVTSMSFRTKNNTAKWTEEETKKFYKAIEIFGADFSMIAKLFPTRNRDQVKNKFRKEEKVNTKIMDEAFRKNSILGKRSIMDRIQSFNRIVSSENSQRELVLEEGIRLERSSSNTSNDSMDLKIMEEIQQIFVKEILPQKNLAALGNLGQPRMEEAFETSHKQNVVTFKNVEQIEENKEQEKTKNEEAVPVQKQNLLQKFLIQK